jgi:hypothetical protein
VTDAPSLPIRIALATAAALCAVLVPGQAAALMDRPFQPRWPRRRPRPVTPSPRAVALRPADTV